MFKRFNFLFVSMMLTMTLLSVNMYASGDTPAETAASDQKDVKNVKTLKAGEYVTIFMGREARNITVSWGADTDCEFEIQMSCGHGVFTSVAEEKAKGKGAVTYSYIRTSVEDLRIVITKGKATITNMSTLSTKADDNQTYNPV